MSHHGKAYYGATGGFASATYETNDDVLNLLTNLLSDFTTAMDVLHSDLVDVKNGIAALDSDVVTGFVNATLALNQISTDAYALTTAVCGFGYTGETVMGLLTDIKANTLATSTDYSAVLTDIYDSVEPLHGDLTSLQGDVAATTSAVGTVDVAVGTVVADILLTNIALGSILAAVGSTTAAVGAASTAIVASVGAESVAVVAAIGSSTTAIVNDADSNHSALLAATIGGISQAHADAGTLDTDLNYDLSLLSTQLTNIDTRLGTANTTLNIIDGDLVDFSNRNHLDLVYVGGELATLVTNETTNLTQLDTDLMTINSNILLTNSALATSNLHLVNSDTYLADIDSYQAATNSLLTSIASSTGGTNTNCIGINTNTATLTSQMATSNTDLLSIAYDVNSVATDIATTNASLATIDSDLNTGLGLIQNYVSVLPSIAGCTTSTGAGPGARQIHVVTP